MSVASRSRIDAIEAVGRSFKGATAALRRLRSREQHHPGELSHAQYGLLFGLHGGEPLSLRELAVAADVSPATATEMLDVLAAQGLVQRTRSELDKRIVLTALTERGAALIEGRRRRFEPRWRAAFEDFGDGELMTAAAVLDAIAQLFDELAVSGD
jgi:DNA-binding MarR family transcriptional regulator